MVSTRRRFLLLLMIPIVVFCIGIVGYMLIEGWPLTEALYMTAITLSTVGFGEVQPLSPTGRWFTIILILLGAGSLAYGFSTIGEYLLTAGVGERLRRRRMMNVVDKLANHVIVCGYGRVGQSAVAALNGSTRPFVLIEKDEPEIQQALETG
ncbi:MAG TPA: potassium channel family protein, partial [Anaerolineae bacterium]